MTEHKPPQEPRRPALPTSREAQLERFIGNVLRDQPMRRAPATLEARVLARIQQQQAMPWHRAGFAQWPMAVRIAVLLALVAVAKITLDVVVWLFSDATPVTHTVESSVSWAKSTASLFTTLTLLCQSLIDLIPTHWLVLALAFAASMYLMLFALGATAYRTLYLNK